MSTSSAVKRKYNAKAYDQINLTVKKGQKTIIQAHAEDFGESVNAFINRAIKDTMQMDIEDREFNRKLEQQGGEQGQE